MKLHTMQYSVYSCRFILFVVRYSRLPLRTNPKCNKKHSKTRYLAEGKKWTYE